MTPTPISNCSNIQVLTHKEVTSGLVCDKISHPRKMQDSIRFLSGHGSSISDYHSHSGLEIVSELATRFEKKSNASHGDMFIYI